MSRTGALRCLLAALLFGASTPLAARLAGDMPSLVLAGLLYVGAALAVSPLLWRDRRTLPPLRRGGSMLALSVTVGGALAPVLLVMGLTHVPAATASLLLNVEVVATAVVAALFFKEQVGPRVGAALVLVAAAGVCLVWRPGAHFAWSALLVVAAAVAWGIDNNATAHIEQLLPAQITWSKGVVAGSVNVLLGLALSTHRGLSPVHCGEALLIGGFGYGLSLTLWVSGSRQIGATRGQILFASAPFWGALVAWTIFHERISALQIVALALAAGGVALALDRGHEHLHRHPAVDDAHVHEHSHDDLHSHEHTGTERPRGSHTHTHAHAHAHAHEPTQHAHPHLPDVHHHHDHDEQ